MKVFISYGGASDQVTALRLQALGSVNGLTVYVPPAFTLRESASDIDPEAALKLREADVVLGIVGNHLTEACRRELEAGFESRKSMIVMAYESLGHRLERFTGSSLVLIDPEDAGSAEAGVVRLLKALNAPQASKKALLALSTLALGLTMLTPVHQD